MTAADDHIVNQARVITRVFNTIPRETIRSGDTCMIEAWSVFSLPRSLADQKNEGLCSQCFK